MIGHGSTGRNARRQDNVKVKGVVNTVLQKL
jgi:hypothetical protein